MNAEQNGEANVTQTETQKTESSAVSVLPGDGEGEGMTNGQQANGTAGTQQTEGAQGTQGAKDGQTDGNPAQGQTGQDADYGGLTVPEGYAIDQAAMAELTPLLTEAKATPETAQKFIDMHVAQLEKMRANAIKEEQETVRAWEEALKNDPDIGGAKLDENLALGKKVLLKYGSPELTEALETFHLGSYTPFVKFVVALAKEVRPDTMLDFGSNAQEQSDSAEARAKRMFPNSFK